MSLLSVEFAPSVVKIKNKQSSSDSWIQQIKVNLSFRMEPAMFWENW